MGDVEFLSIQELHWYLCGMKGAEPEGRTLGLIYNPTLTHGQKVRLKNEIAITSVPNQIPLPGDWALTLLDVSLSR